MGERCTAFRESRGEIFDQFLKGLAELVVITCSVEAMGAKICPILALFDQFQAGCRKR